jgi:hypothetical protein
MKAPGAQLEGLSCEFLRRVLAATTRLAFMGTAFLALWAQTVAGQAPTMPVVTINPATNVTAFSATITGSVSPNGFPVSVFVGWGSGLNYYGGEFETVPAQNAPVPVSITLSNLMSNTTYNCSLSAVNVAAGLTVWSGDISFTTLEAQTAVTGPATDITATSATIYANLNPNGFDTTYYFQWGTNTAYGNATPSFSVQSQNTPINGIAAGLTGLSPSTTTSSLPQTAKALTWEGTCHSRL